MQKLKAGGGVSHLKASFSRDPLLEAVGRVQYTFGECCVAEVGIGSDAYPSAGGIGLTTKVSGH